MTKRRDRREGHKTEGQGEQSEGERERNRKRNGKKGEKVDAPRS